MLPRIKISLIGLYLIAIASCALAQPGQVDSSFAQHGTFEGHVWDGCFFKTLIQPDNKILGMSFYGGTATGSVMVRLNPEGNIDTTFGSKGWAAPFTWGDAWDITLQPDGKIVAVGDGTDLMALVYRRNSDGSRDTTFGVKGGVYITLLSQNIDLTSVKVLQNGKIILAGWSPSNGSKILLIRLLPNGAFDPSFGDTVTGIKIYSVSGFVTRMLFQSNGKIVIGAIQNNHGLLLRLNQDGSIDSTFGINGHTITPCETYIVPYYNNSLLCQKDGKILFTGYWNPGDTEQGRIVRFTIDGKIDSTFGVNGVCSLNYFGINSAVCQWDDKILCTIFQERGNGTWWQVVRLNPNGTIDTAFGKHGYTNAIPVAGAISYSVAVQHQGKIVVGGVCDKPSPIWGKPYDAYYEMMRYFSGLPCPQPTASFSDSVLSNMVLQFQDRSSSATLWHWDFGDSTSSEVRNPVHAFRSFGKYHVCLSIIDSCGNDSHCDSIIVKPNGIASTSEDRIHLYPNPASGTLTIDISNVSEKMDMAILRIDGKEVLNRELINAKTTIDISALPAGVYILKITDASTVLVRKIVKV